MVKWLSPLIIALPVALVGQFVLGWSAYLVFILALVSVPFAFFAGNRGAMTGVGISIAIFIAYWSADQVFEQVGQRRR